MRGNTIPNNTLLFIVDSYNCLQICVITLIMILIFIGVEMSSEANKVQRILLSAMAITPTFPYQSYRTVRQ